ANDNIPIFYPREYKVSVGENVLPSSASSSQINPLVIVAATDLDSPRSPFGQIEYEIKSGNEKNYFDIDRKSGEIFLLKPLSAIPGSSSHTQYKLTVTATDGGGRESKEAAMVLISVVPQQSDSIGHMIPTPIFLQRQFNFQVIENVAQGAIVGTVRAKIDNDDEDDQPISYSIYSGDPDGYFTIDPRHGTISVKSSSIDREKHSFLLLNVQAYAGRYPGPYRYAHTQINITILDENDNVPMFPSPTLKISVPENIPIDNGTVFVAYAIDYDSDNFGRIRYQLYPATNHDSDDRERFPFIIEERTGHVRLRRSLDYETRNEYQIRVVAIDGGQLSSEMLVHIFIQDVSIRQYV
ncbi:Cadherin-23 precursor-like protein, partial [Euroglyphus maynei]